LCRYNPKLPPFDETTDDMNSYVKLFETFAHSQKWPEDKWVVGLNTLLRGKSLDVFSRLALEGIYLP